MLVTFIKHFGVGPRVRCRRRGMFYSYPVACSTSWFLGNWCLQCLCLIYMRSVVVGYRVWPLPLWFYVRGLSRGCTGQYYGNKTVLSTLLNHTFPSFFSWHGYLGVEARPQPNHPVQRQSRSHPAHRVLLRVQHHPPPQASQLHPLSGVHGVHTQRLGRAQEDSNWKQILWWG